MHSHHSRASWHSFGHNQKLRDSEKEKIQTVVIFSPKHPSKLIRESQSAQVLTSIFEKFMQMFEAGCIPPTAARMELAAFSRAVLVDSNALEIACIRLFSGRSRLEYKNVISHSFDRFEISSLKHFSGSNGIWDQSLTQHHFASVHFGLVFQCIFICRISKLVRGPMRYHYVLYMILRLCTSVSIFRAWGLWSRMSFKDTNTLHEICAPQ